MTIAPDASVATQVVDVAVHPYPRNSNDLRAYMTPPLDKSVFPVPLRSLYPVPTNPEIGGAFLESARTSDSEAEATYWKSPDLPASDPAAVRTALNERGIGHAVLTPLGRGVLPNRQVGSEIASATNRWLSETWLNDANSQYWGSIRVNGEDVPRACQEIERWASDPRMVQVAVSLESHRPYGHPEYAPIWQTAVDHGLPVAIYADGGSSIQYPPTANGLPGSFTEFSVMYPMNAFYHLMSFIAEGVFERLPDLRITFGEGAFDTLMPLILRADMDWPITKHEIPWVKTLPSSYVRQHVRFVASRFDRPPSDLVADWFERADAEHLLVFGSRYPQWHAMAPDELLPEVEAGKRAAILRNNALDLFPGLT